MRATTERVDTTSVDDSWKSHIKITQDDLRSFPCCSKARTFPVAPKHVPAQNTITILMMQRPAVSHNKT